MLTHARTLAPLLPLAAMAAVIAPASRRSRAGRSQDDPVVAGTRGAAEELAAEGYMVDVDPMLDERRRRQQRRDAPCRIDLPNA